MIAKREEEIRQFKPVPFYRIQAQTKALALTWQDQKTKQIRLFDQERSKQLAERLRNKEALVLDVQKSPKKKFSPQLYDLTELQREAHNRFGYSAKDTLSIMQRLYEQHKLVTYPRTDSRYLSSDLVDTLPDRIAACSVQPYTKFTMKVDRKKIRASKHFVDDSKVSDHHAIIPTEQRAMLSSLNDKERKIYDLIVKRFLAVLFPPFEYEQTTIQAKVENELLIAKGKRILSLGWKELYDSSLEEEEKEEDVAEQRLPTIEKGEKLKILSVQLVQGETQPPKPFNEGTLLSAMENPMRYMESDQKELIKTLEKTGGLGTVATRADIIEKLFNSFLLEKRGKDIYTTSKGRQLLDLVPEELKSPRLTAEWEKKLEAISKASLTKQAFIGEIRGYTKAIVQEIKYSESRFRHDNLTGAKCPECGKPMLEVKGKKGTLHVCQDRECGHRKNVAKVTNARCPECKKKLELRGQGEGQVFVCKCGYKEKLTTFNERRKKEKEGKASKKDVSQFLQKQKKEEPMNTALADALAKLKLDN